MEDREVRPKLFLYNTNNRKKLCRFLVLMSDGRLSIMNLFRDILELAYNNFLLLINRENWMQYVQVRYHL